MLNRIGKQGQARPAFDLQPKDLSRLAREYLVPQKKTRVVEQVSPLDVRKAASGVQLSKTEFPSVKK